MREFKWAVAAMVLFVGLQTRATNTHFSRACGSLVKELAVWGISLDHTIQLRSGPAVFRGYNQGPRGTHIEAFEDLMLSVDSRNITQIASTLSLGNVKLAVEFEKRLTELAKMGVADTSLVPFLPSLSQERIGRSDSHSCYYGALNFHEDFSSITGVDLDRPLNLDILYARYTGIGFQDKLQYGDLLLFRTVPSLSNQNSFSFHAARYLGGDFVYHKYSPASVFRYEFTTVESLIRIYSNPLVGQMQDVMASNPLFAFSHLVPTGFRYGQPFVIEFLRYDPEKKKPAALLNPNRHNIQAPFHSVTRGSAPSRVVVPNIYAEVPLVGRNEPCPCGSGLKYKKCHGRR